MGTPRTTRPRSMACAPRARSPPKRVTARLMVSARRARPACDSMYRTTLNPVLSLLLRLGRTHSEITSRDSWLHESELLAPSCIDGAMRVLDSESRETTVFPKKKKKKKKKKVRCVDSTA